MATIRKRQYTPGGPFDLATAGKRMSRWGRHGAEQVMAATLFEEGGQQHFEPDWPGWTYQGTINAIVGPPGSFKSMFLSQFALNKGAGKPALVGETEPLTQGAVILISTENGRKRESIRVYSLANGLGLSSTGPVSYWQPRCPMTKDQQIKFFAQLERQIQDVEDLGPVTVIIDPVQDIGGIADDDNLAARRFISEFIKPLVYQHDRVTVYLVFHTGKNQERGIRGPSEFKNTVDAVITFAKVEEALIRISAAAKQRDQAARQDILVRFEQDAGKVYRLRLVERLDDEEPDLPKAKAKLRIMTLLRSTGETGLEIQMVDDMLTTGRQKVCSPKTARTARQELEAAGLIETLDRGKKHFIRLIEKEQTG